MTSFLKRSHRLSRAARLGLVVLALGTAGQAAEKTTYEDKVLPILRNRCLKCHGSDQQKADLNLSSFSGVLKGSGSGAVVEGGDPDSSFLYLVITHAEEPTMPPKDKLPDAEIEVIRQWIAGGLLESSGSKAIVSSKPKVNLALANGAAGRPEGPPPLPVDVLALDPYVVTERTSVSTALAVSPWAPLVALGGQRQVLLYNTDTLMLEGVVPFGEGYPHDVKFSANGQLLVVGGGRGAQRGVSIVWDILKGEQIIAVGDDYDAVLATDISPDQRFIAHGGPDRFVRIFSTSTGRLAHQIKKHTDWVTAIRFSQDGKYLATGDRNGGLEIWETALGSPVGTLNGHKDRITGIEWANTNIVLSSSEDGTVKIWNTDEVKEIKSWNAHGGGTLFLNRIQNGLLATCGRNNRATLWDANGGRQRDFVFPGDLPSTAAASHDGKRIIGTDWSGQVWVWDAEDGKELGRLSLNPPLAAQQLAIAREAHKASGQALAKAQGEISAAETELEKARQEMVMMQEQADASRRLAETAQAEVEKLTQQREKSQAKLQKADQAHQAAQEALSAAQDQDVTLAKAAEDTRAARLALSEAFSSLNTALVEARKNADTRQSEAQKAGKSWQEAKDGYLKERIENRQKKVDETRQNLARADQDHAQATANLEAWTRKKVYNDFFQARRVWQQQQDHQQTLVAGIESTEAELKQWRDDLAAARQVDGAVLKAQKLAEYQAAQKEQETLAAALEELNAAMETSEQALAAITRSQEEVSLQLTSLPSALETAEAEHAKRDKETNELRQKADQRLAQLNKEVEEKEKPALLAMDMALKFFNEAPALKAAAETKVVQIKERVALQLAQVEQAEKRVADASRSLQESAQRLAQQTSAQERAAREAAALRSQAAQARTAFDRLVAERQNPAQVTVDSSKQALAALDQNRQAARQWQAYVDSHLPAAKNDFDTAHAAAIRAETSAQAVGRNAKALQMDLDRARQDLDKALARMKKAQEEGREKDPDFASAQTARLLAEQQVKELEVLWKSEQTQWQDLESEAALRREDSDRARSAWEELATLQKTSADQALSSEAKARESLAATQAAAEKILAQMNLEAEEARQRAAQVEEPARLAEQTAQGEAAKRADMSAAQQKAQAEMEAQQQELMSVRETWKGLMEMDLVQAQQALTDATQAMEIAPSRKNDAELNLAKVRQEIDTTRKAAEEAGQKARLSAEALEVSRDTVQALKRQQTELQSKMENLSGQQTAMEKQLAETLVKQSAAQEKWAAQEKNLARLQLAHENAEADQARRLAELEKAIGQARAQLQAMQEEASQAPAHLEMLKARMDQQQQAYEQRRAAR